MTSSTETEVKLYVPHLEAMARRLEAAGAKLETPRVFERNVRYENLGETLSAAGIVVRLREDERIRLTYKGPGHVSNDIMSRYEAEVEVSSFATMAEILAHLGYHPYLTYEKYRTTYTLSGAEIVLDEMPYGNFIEIEGEVETIEALIGQLELADAPRFGTSYVGLFNLVCQRMGLDFRDLTFENFAGIDVPMWAFRAEEP